jgi:predicted Zn-dependent protease
VILAGAMAPAVMGQAADSKSAESATNPVDIYIARARTQDAQGRHDLASANWRQVLLLSPRQPEALAALARFYREAGDAADAQVYLDRLRAVAPQHAELKPQKSSLDDQSILDQAARLSQEHRYREALELYRKVLGDNPTSGDWAVVYYETEAAIPGEQPHAVQSLRGIVNAYPANPNYALALAKVLTYGTATRAEGLRMLQEIHGSPQITEEARKAWREALLWDPSSSAAQESGAAYVARYPDGELAAKLHAGQEAHVRTESLSTPEEAEAYRSLQSGDLAAASKQFSELARRPGQAARAHLGLAYVAMKQQDFENAVVNFEQARNEGLHSSAIDAAFHDARYWQLMQRANKASDAGDDTAALSNFEEASKIDPNRPEANEALAGLWVKKQQPEKALSILREVLRSHSDRENAWLALSEAELQAGQFSQLLAQQKNIPAAIQEKLNQEPDYLAALASAQLSLGNDADAQNILARLDSLSSSNTTSRAQIDLKLAGLMLRQDRVEDAVKMSRNAIHADRSNPEGWQTLIRAEDQAGRDGSALQLIENMPAPVKDKLDHDPGFLIQAASIYQKQHEYDGAALMLQHAQQIGARDLQTSIPLQLQLASLDLEMGRTARAYEIYRQLTREVPDRSEAWIGMLSAMHAGKHDAEALEAAQAMPAELRFSLRKDTSYLQAMASIYSGNGDDTRAMECLKRVTAHYHEQGIAVPFAVNLQYAWLQLNAGNEAGLSASLDSLSKTKDLSPAHKKQVEDLWVAWSIRRAEATLQTGGADQAFKLLDAAMEVYPNNADLRHEAGTLYIRRGQPENAYRLYEHFEWDGASESDFSGGIAAAAASNHWKQAEIWLHVGLNQYPGNRQLLTEAAQIEQEHGDLKKAQAYWSSLRALDDPNSESGTLAGIRPVTTAAAPVNQLAAMLMPAPNMTRPQPTQHIDADQADAESNDELFSNSASDAGVEPIQNQIESAPAVTGHGPSENSDSDTLVVSPISSRVPRHTPTVNEMSTQMQNEAQVGSGRMQLASSQQYPEGSEQLSTEGPAHRDILDATDPSQYSSSSSAGETANLVAPNRLVGSYPVASNVRPMILGTSSIQSKDDGLASLQAQMSPWVGGGAAANSRSGSAGFDQLTRVESTVETSTILAQSLRLTAVLKPVLLESGQASATPLYAWGTAGTAPTGNQYASGVGGEIQMASAHVQASLGYSPTSFPVQNTLGSVSLMPTRSFSLHFSREQVKDTLLSYAGATDPKTGQVWGGVVATGGGVQVGHGDAKSGFYALLDYASLTGRNVTANTRISGSMGGYWKGYTNDYGALTIGLNMTGLHYDKNLQYFTFGQGGYFSPDIYMLINAPITWTSKPIQNFSYIVTGSVGTQSYQQGAVVAGSLLTDVYATPSASANYVLDARGSYRITPNWYLEAFLSANNTYDYQQRTAGFSLKYMTHPHPAGDSAMPTGLFDVQAIRPLLVP